MNMRSALQGYFVLFIASLFYAYEFIHRLSPGAMIPELMATFDVSATQLGTLSAMYFYSYGLFQIPAGIIVDRFRLKYVLFMASFLIALGSLIQAQTNIYSMVLFARTIIGIGSAFGFVTCVKVGTTWFHEHRLPIIIGITNLFGVCGAFIGGAPLVYSLEALGWQSVYNLSCVIGLSIALLAFFFVRTGPHFDETDKEQCSKKSIKHLLRSKLTWLIAIYAALTVAPITAFAELWSIPFFETVYSLSREQSAYANSFIFLGIAFGSPCIGWIASHSRIPTRTLMAFFSFLAMSFLSLILYGFTTTYSILLVALFSYGFVTSNMLLSFSLVTKINPSNCTGLVIGFTNTLVMISGAFFQPAIGSIIDHFAHSTGASLNIMLSSSIQWALLPLSLCLLIALFVMLITPIPSLKATPENRS